MGERKRKQLENRASSFPVMIWILVAASVLVLLLVGGMIGFLINGVQNETLAPSASRQQYLAKVDPAQDPLWPLIKEVADQFLCGCGKCGGMELTGCDCLDPLGGIAEREYIRKQLVAGHSVAEVVTDVESKYGFRKSPADFSNGATVSTPFPDKSGASK